MTAKELERYFGRIDRAILIAFCVIGLIIVPTIWIKANAQVKISALPDGAALTGAEQIPSVQALATTKATTAQISAYVLTNLQNAGQFGPSGTWQFAGGSTVTIPSVQLFNGNPQFEIRNNVAPADIQRWNMTADTSGFFRLRRYNNTGTTPSEVFNTDALNLTITPSIVSTFPATNADYSFAVKSINPQFGLWKTDGAADAKRWDWVSIGNDSQHRACNDAGNNCATYVTATRSGVNVTAMTYGHAASSTLHTFNGGPVIIPFTASGTNSGLTLTSNLPRLEFINTAAPAQNRRVIEYTDTGGSHRKAICQDNTTCNDYMQVTRTGSSVSAVKILTGNSTERLAINSNGSWSVGGAAGAAGEVLMSNGASAAPAWQTIGSAVTTTGTFTATYSDGFTTQPTQTFTYAKVGPFVILSATSDPTGTSNASTWSAPAGTVPAAIRPANGPVVVMWSVIAANNGNQTQACMQLTSDGSLLWGIRPEVNSLCATQAWTASGTKGFFGVLSANNINAIYATTN